MIKKKRWHIKEVISMFHNVGCFYAFISKMVKAYIQT